MAKSDFAPADHIVVRGKNHAFQKGVFLNYIEDHEEKVLKISKISRISTKNQMFLPIFKKS